MIKLFRTIRKKFLNEGRSMRYLAYAFGEIVLVVIGILLALQINNWNTDRMDRSIIANYYDRIHAEIRDEIQVIESFNSRSEELIRMNKRTLSILSSKNHDSIPALKSNLGALGTAWTLNVSFPVTDEFLDQGYLSKVGNDSLKLAFKIFTHSMENIREMNQYINSQYNHRIEPYINKHVNYSEVALPGYKRRLIAGGPPTDFEFLFTDLELWNVVTFKLEGLDIYLGWNERIIERLERLDRLILEELEHSDTGER